MALTLEIVTPAQRVLTVTCDEVRAPGEAGGFGVRPGHTALVAALVPGELSYVTGGTVQRFAVGEGFAEVAEDRVRILVEEAVRAEELDPAAVQRDLDARRKKLEGLRESDPEYSTARAQVERAAARAFVARR
jgi:F-type H+-transporting ATPase subunit epsilon